MKKRVRIFTDHKKAEILRNLITIDEQTWSEIIDKASNALSEKLITRKSYEKLLFAKQILLKKEISSKEWSILKSAESLINRIQNDQLRRNDHLVIRNPGSVSRHKRGNSGKSKQYYGTYSYIGDSIAKSENRSSQQNPNKRQSEDLGNGQVEIFFGTNRTVHDASNTKKYFGSKVDTLRVGNCIINIPKTHKQGRIERPPSLFGWELTKANDEKHIRLKELQELESKAFYKQIRDKLGPLDEQSALVFIHGYNNTFEQAAWRAGQFAWDLPFGGITALFSWPSAGRTTSYATDMDRADQSVPAFKQFLIDLIENTGVQKVHLVAHSMGNRVMTGALKELANEPEHAEKLNLIEQIVLAAPDLDQGVFRDTLLPKFKELGNRKTLYASRKDKALWAAEVIRDGNPRLGDGGEDLFISEGIDSIDASNVKSKGAHHSYVFQVNEVLTDIFYLFKNSFAPDERRLMKYEREGKVYWGFKDW